MSKSEEAIKEALQKLTEEKPFSKITVADICAEADVSRRTFYKYFENIESVVERIVHDRMVESTLKIRELLPVDDNRPLQTLMHEASINSLYENRHFYDAVMHYKGRWSLLQCILENLQPFNFSVYEQYLGDTDENRFVSYLFAWFPFIALCWWKGDGKDVGPEETAQLLDKWALAHLHATIRGES